MTLEELPNTKTPIGGWIKAVFMQEGDLPTVADCCRLAALVEHGVVAKSEHKEALAASEKVRREVAEELNALADYLKPRAGRGTYLKDMDGVLVSVLDPMKEMAAKLLEGLGAE